ncbi:MAG TPA: TetR/AcrR family transcriptional regulator, partial [Solirubrobacteraceae bacterium]|nr:TetR/AcrR family transcriptional regulator [Solirubrobacteraceae bacterium]
MPARNVRPTPRQGEAGSARFERAGEGTGAGRPERYRRLPSGAQRLDPEEVKRDQRDRLQTALIELVAERGYRAVRVLDISKLARVSQPTLYSLYDDKEELFLAAYDEISRRTEETVIEAYEVDGSERERLKGAIMAFGQLAAAQPEMIVALGAFGAGAKALQRRNRALGVIEEHLYQSRARATAAEAAGASAAPRRKRRGTSAVRRRRPASTAGDEATSPLRPDLTVKAIIGGVGAVTATRLRHGRLGDLPALSDELAAWAVSYPLELPAGLECPVPSGAPAPVEAMFESSERARRARGPLPSGRHELPRHVIVKSQRERIVDAIGAIVAEKGLARLTIPEIAQRANISNQTFYEMYETKQDALLGAQKAGMRQAQLVIAEAYEAHRDCWPDAVAAGLRALIEFVVSEPAHAHLNLIDTFVASPASIEIRAQSLQAFAAYLGPGEDERGENP